MGIIITTVIITVVILVYAILFIFILFLITKLFLDMFIELSDFSVLTSTTLYVPDF